MSDIFPTSRPQQVDASAAVNTFGYSSIEFQFSAGTVSVTRSLDSQNYVACNVIDKDGNILTSATAPGIYSVDGNAMLKFSAPVTFSAGL